jgi:ABC-type transport system involved in multi-copper enzyme maturation permease subunit
MKPRPDRFIAEGGENWIPPGLCFIPYGYTFVVREISATNKSAGAVNSRPFEADLSFLVKFLLSFFSILLTFNALTGEKEKGTLRLIFSNSVKRATFLLSKYSSAIVMLLWPFLFGLISSIFFFSLSSSIPVSKPLILNFLMFLFPAFLYISLFVLLGLLFSALSTTSKNSLVSSLLAWIFLVVILPKASGFFLSFKQFDVPAPQKIEDIAEQGWKEIWNKYASLDYETRTGNDESTRLNAKISVEAQKIRQEIYDSYLRKKIETVETIKRLNFLSPASLFEYSASSIAGTGILHFQSLWNQVNRYREKFLEFFEAEDQKDPESFHIYYHPDYLSKKSIDFNRIPKFEEKNTNVKERFQEAAIYTGLLIFYNLFLFLFVFYRFQKYDVR